MIGGIYQTWGKALLVEWVRPARHTLQLLRFRQRAWRSRHDRGQGGPVTDDIAAQQTDAFLGDPATRLRTPAPLEVAVERTAAGWRWTATRPAGATDLVVGLRPHAVPRARPAKEPLPPEEARRRFEEANGAFAFRPLPAPTGDAPWTGEVVEKGLLRLVARTPVRLHVATLSLK